MSNGRLKAPPTERLIFWSMAILLLSQMGWWISLQVRESRRMQQAKIDRMRAGRAEAWQMDTMEVLQIKIHHDSTDDTPGTVEGRIIQQYTPLYYRKQAIENRFPYVAVVAAPVEEDDLILVDNTAYLTLRKDVLAAMDRERTLALWRTGGQGALLACVVLMGMVYIYRKLNAELELKLRQRNFIASVTHELKTPIASLRVWMETIFMRKLEPERLARIHYLMDGDLLRLTDLVANLLEVARADAGQLDISLEPMELAPWLHSVCDHMDARLGPGQLGLHIEAAEGIWINGDPKRLGTVLENLLSNAFKYAPEPRFTTVTLDGNQEDAILVVSDRGNGIQPRDLPKLFQRFFRVGNEMTRGVPGTGLGLFLCKEIIQRHRGDIRASSLGPGLGTSFTIRLPRRMNVR
ncbi:MAG TPA: HAMP domain-containing sensor histidine kinase [Holophaga sp.]|nr:HAMP domain-containing sensor histidine kinase [Holophaga sp.]